MCYTKAVNIHNEIICFVIHVGYDCGDILEKYRFCLSGKFKKSVTVSFISESNL